jgi:hypothetical protein
MATSNSSSGSSGIFEAKSGCRKRWPILKLPPTNSPGISNDFDGGDFQQEGMRAAVLPAAANLRNERREVWWSEPGKELRSAEYHY